MPKGGYYSRESATFVDGSPIFKTEADRRNEETVAGLIKSAWRCELLSMGELSAVDWCAIRDGRIVGWCELKSRSHEVGKYPTVFLNLRKWLALQFASLGNGAPPIFIVKWVDDVRWINVHKIPQIKMSLGGCGQVVKARSDWEPVIEVPIPQMVSLRKDRVA